MATVKVKAPDGFHWMNTKGGPILMEGDYQPHDGASEAFEFEVVESHEGLELIEKPGPGKRSKEWDRIFEAILESTGNRNLAAATATARVGKAKDDPKTPAKPSERRSGSTRNPEGSASGGRGGIKLSEANIKTLENLRDEHNEDAPKDRRADLGALKAVFRRGAGAFSTSHRPSVSSRDQWAVARVKAFLKLLRSGRPSNPKYTTDNDLLPASHPRSSKAEKSASSVLFVISTPTPLDKARGAHLCGTTGVTFAKSYLEPIGLTRDDVDVISLDELKAAATRSPSVVVALGKAAKQVLGSAADCHLPHPQAIRKAAHRENLGRRLQELDALIIKAEDSYQPPKGVQEAAARGLKLRQEHGRGGTEVGVARARDLSNGRRVSRDTVMRMASFFERHAGDLKAPKNKDPGAPGYPGAGLVAHLLWGGDPGVTWSARIKAQIQREEASKSKQPVAISKADDAKRVVYGVVLDPYLVGDAHNDWVSAQEIEEAAHGWMAGSRVIGLEHNGEEKGATVVESWLHPYPTTEDYRAAIKGEPHQAYRSKFGNDVVHSGSWILGVKLSPERWADVQEGKLNAFSIGGTGTREPMSEAERPEVDFIDQG